MAARLWTQQRANNARNRLSDRLIPTQIAAAGRTSSQLGCVRLLAAPKIVHDYRKFRASEDARMTAVDLRPVV